MKKIIPLLLLASSLWQAPAHAQDKGKIGISMPTVALQRWVIDGLALGRSLGKLDYEPDLKFADNAPKQQIAQIEKMITDGVRVLIVAPVDGPALKDVLQKAADKKIKIISYDRLIRDTPNIDGYATFDNYQVGVMQGEDIVNRLGLKDKAGPFSIELFAGSPDDNNAFFFYNGAMSVLKPYIENGRLVVESGQTAMEAIATPQWNGVTARLRLDKLMTAFYKTKRLDAILAPNDGISLELLATLKRLGYGSQGKEFPVVTGQDADLNSVRSIIKSEQSSTIFKDTRALADVAVNMADALMQNKPIPVNDTKTYNNGVKLVNSFLLKPVLVDKSNWSKILVDSGYYKSYVISK
ncbi:multiple monosaccharide ABC transporter substrate-binding protein [Rhodoferax sp.]|uniref:multiple monosaccharide ABC transporter substrate-binding protein n=1 Tax=Rhodoferax sp. TaxID=50421 RepID=UPI002ACE127E|nr:multiple monosaccharide ABC transporter substrate-binding protein [Rhodoferax sp.]MDZ7919336.1 multiple monosaccharide ABC transporter substrate-binding protein [Rhodoferax sp.]